MTSSLPHEAPCGTVRSLAGELTRSISAARRAGAQATVADGIARTVQSLAVPLDSAAAVLKTTLEDGSGGVRVIAPVAGAFRRAGDAAQDAVHYSRSGRPARPDQGEADLLRTVLDLADAADAAARAPVPSSLAGLSEVTGDIAATATTLAGALGSLGHLAADGQAAGACFTASCYLSRAGEYLDGGSRMLAGTIPGPPRPVSFSRDRVRADVADLMAVRRYRAGEPPARIRDRELFHTWAAEDLLSLDRNLAGGNPDLYPAAAGHLAAVAREEHAGPRGDHWSCGGNCPWESRDLPVAERAARAYRNLSAAAAADAFPGGLRRPAPGPPPKGTDRRLHPRGRHARSETRHKLLPVPRVRRAAGPGCPGTR